MIPGPTYVYACPDCQLRVSNRSIMSGNTFGATQFSDLRIDAPMMPSYPRISKCERCDCTFWLDDETKVEGTVGIPFTALYDDDFTPNETKNPVFGDQLEINSALELDQESIKDALFMNVQRDEEDEKHLRYLLLWAYHKQLLDGTILRENLNEDLDYRENIDALLNLIEEDEGSTIFCAELNRFVGRFDRCFELLEPFVEEFMGPIVGEIHDRCLAGNRDVFEMNYS
jgi:hypothetical protein